MGCIGSPNYLKFSPYQISSPLQQLPKSFTSHWFLIQVVSSIINISTFGNSKKIYFSSENMVANGWFKMYINQEQFQFLKDSTHVKLFPIENKNKISTRKKNLNKEYYIHASRDWTPPIRSRIISRISDEIFLVDNLIIDDKLKNDKRILKIRAAGTKKTLNRYTSGFLQTGEQISYYRNNIFAPLRPLHEIGLNGRGQIVNVVDTGVDVFNAFFYDPNPDNNLTSITNKTNLNHRKVVRIESIVDNTDDLESGHGTHAAGTLCGSSYCTDCGISQYNGVAPEAKLYFSDIGDSKTGDLIGVVDLDEQSNIFHELNVHISSNSWGYSLNEPEVQFNYNKAAYEHPDILYLFASGNDADYNTINCPANAKNVFAVTSSDMISAAQIENSVTQIEVQNETNKIVAMEMMARHIRQYSISPQMKYLNDLPLVKYQGPDCRYVIPENCTSDDDDDDECEKSVYNCTDTDFDYNLYNGSVVLLDSQSGVDEDFCLQVQKVAEFGGRAALYSPQDPFLRCDISPTIPMVFIDSESIPELLTMGNISILPVSGIDGPLPGANSGASKGPADSGLRKPEIMTPGSSISSAKSHGPTIENITANMTFSDNIVSKSGTSMATPAAAGLATIIFQYLSDGFYPYLKKGTGKSITPTSCLLRALLVNTAIKPEQEADESKSVHRNDVGYGIPFLQNILGFNETGLRFADNQFINSSSHLVYIINLDSNSTDLHVTLVYLDPPLNIDNEGNFFADLDLYVKSPSGQIYHGNNVSEGDIFSLIEKVVFDSSEISPEGGQFEIHVVSNDYPIPDQSAMFSIVINGPFNMSDLEKNELEMTARVSDENDCPRDCSGHGKCVDGICVCDLFHVGLSCNISQSLLADGSSYEEELGYEDVRYFMVPLNGSQNPIEGISFDIVKSDNLGLLYFCTSFDESPGKLTGSDWLCRFACPPNISDPDEGPQGDDYPFFENVTMLIPPGENPSYLNIAVYTGFNDKLMVSLNNLKVLAADESMTASQPPSLSKSLTFSPLPTILPTESQSPSRPPLQTTAVTEIQTPSDSPLQTTPVTEIQTPSDSPLQTTAVTEIQTPSDLPLQTPTSSPSKKKNTKILFACLVVVIGLVIAAIVILIVVIIKKKKEKNFDSSLGMRLIADHDVSAF